MTALVDTDVLVAYISRREGKHGQADKLLRQLAAGTWGAPLTSDYILDEALTLMMGRGARASDIDRLLQLTMEPVTPGGRAILPVTRVADTAFEAAIPLFRRHLERGLSFTDCTSLALMASRGIDVLLSFDHGFDGLVARIDA